MNEVKFSIIIPVWNVEKFIANCFRQRIGSKL